MSDIISAGAFVEAYQFEGCLIATLGKTDLHLIGPRRLYATNVQRHWKSFDQYRSEVSGAFTLQGEPSRSYATVLSSIKLIMLYGTALGGRSSPLR